MHLTRKEFLKLASAGAAGAAAGVFSPFLDAPRGFAESVLESQHLRKIHDHIAQNKARHIARVQEYLRQPSVSSWGLGMKECADLLMSYFKRLGCKEVELVKTDGHPGVWAWYDAGAPKTLAYYMMYDTQPFDEKQWSSPPLEANIVEMPPFGDVIMARGAVNDKGADAMVFNALDSILEVVGKLPVNIMFTCDGEEEQGSTHFHQVLAPYLDRLKKCNAHLMLGPSQDEEGGIEVTLGYKGISSMELVCSGKAWGHGPQKRPIHSSRKAILDSPTWRLIKALNTMVKADGNQVLIDGYYDAIRPPNEEETQLYEALVSKFAGRLLVGEKENSKVWMNNWSEAEAVRHLVFDSSLNIDGLWSGYTGPGMATILPDRAAAKIDCRLVPNQEIAPTRELIRQHLDRHGYSDIEIVPIGGGDEWSQTSVKAPVVQALLSVYKHYGIEPMVWPREAGSAPIAQFTRPPLNLPSVGGGLGHGSRAHSHDEYIVIEGNEKVAGIVRAEQSYVDILYAYADWPT
jgi:acetylornithine deacetylase/succinyl-diaminopimelate desuccinylase-like protein